MEKSNRNIWIVLGVAALVACLCLGAFGVGTGIYFWNLSSPAPTTRIPSPTTAPVRETALATDVPVIQTPASTPTKTPTSNTKPETTAQEPIGSVLPPEVSQQMDKIQKQVIDLRGLLPNGSFTRALLTPTQLREKVTTDFFKDYSQADAKNDAIVLAAWGLLEPDFNLIDFYQELYSEQVAGYYDNETKEMYVVQGEGFQGIERMTYAHEYTHALQDQNYDIENGLNFSQKKCEKDSERCAAIQALIEGDATVLELEWLSNLATSQDILDIQKYYQTYKSPVYDSAPAFMKEDFIFPYVNGQTFVDYLKEKGGWEAVDRAYKDLPVSTEQILHPERYPNDKPIPVDIPDLTTTLGEGWREVDRNTMGEWYTYLMLAQGLDPQARVEVSEAQKASEGWGGDAYVVYYNDKTKQTVMVLDTVWDSSREADQFVRSFRKYASARFGAEKVNRPNLYAWQSEAGYSTLLVNGARTTWILAPSQESMPAIQESLQGS